MKELGYTQEDAVGRKLLWNWDGNLNTQRIIGVVKDFHSQALHHAISNYMFQWSPTEVPEQLVASVATTNLPDLIAKLDQDWSTINSGEPFDYFFLDDKLQEAYKTDQRTAGLILAFTLLAIFISCLGLFGLAAFAAESRTKEIGVRKILGASVGSIVGLISREFVWLILLAMFIATPIAFYFLKQWLQNFHYYIDMPWWAFGLAGFSALLIAFATVSFHSIRAAVANPVDALRSE
ncbi:MAG: FtsX-like permease family protein [Bacteroidota bacterium]